MTGTRERLLDTAGRLFAERGFHGVSVRDIVREAQANLGAVTYHFGSKEGLFSAAVVRRIQPLKELGERIAGQDLGPEEKLSRLLEGFAMHVLRDDPGLRVFFLESIGGDDRLPREAIEMVKWRNRIFVDLVEDGVRKGVFRECDTECAAWSFFGMLSAYILYEPLVEGKERSAPFSEEQVSRVVQAALDLFMNGLKARPQARTDTVGREANSGP